MGIKEEIKKVKIPYDEAMGKEVRYRYKVGSWDFPNEEMAKKFIKRIEKEAEI